MDFSTAVFLSIIGLFGGAWNAVAGGATLFTFPALIAAGLPPMTANATNYLAMLPSNVAALPAYRSELRAVGHRVWLLMAVSALGAIAGSLLLLASNPAVFVRLVPFLILFATALFAFGERVRTFMVQHAGKGGGRTLAYGALFFSSIYGGYFGAGLGIILLAIVQVMGFTGFHAANSLKNLLASGFTLVSIAIFGLGGLIAWPEAGVMMCGSTAGGYLGGRYAKHVNERYLRSAVIAFGCILAGVYFLRG